ncbi:MAG: glutathione S-transferase family protein [Parvibaculales bacterium]
MTDYILHHHDPSPYAEKVRKVFALKRCEWLSVQVSMVMPRPDMTLLTGGYRRIPVMQIGADMFYDTQQIAHIIDTLTPEPPLFTSGRAANLAFQKLGDSMFRPGAALSMHENAEHLPPEVIEDRRAYFNFLDFDRFGEDAPHFRSQFRAYAALLEEQLAHGQAYLLGDRPEWADINAFFNIWMAGGNIPSSARMFAPFSKMQDWYQRVEQIEDKGRKDITSKDAIAIATQAQPEPVLLGDATEDESGSAPGDLVHVFADDYGADRVTGTLLHINDQQIVLMREDDIVGEVSAHFPRLGFRIEKQ